MDASSTAEDINDLILAHRYRLSLVAPRQSFFRVVALVFYELEGDDNGHRRHVVGANDEPCSIQGSICAERAALLQLRFLPDLRQITKVVIVTDSKKAITPGMLCREYMTSHSKINVKNMPIVLGGAICNNCGMDFSGPEVTSQSSLSDMDSICGCNGLGTISSRQLHNFLEVKTILYDLFPHPSPYARLCSKAAEELGKLHYYGEDERHPFKMFYPLARDDHKAMIVKYQENDIGMEDAVSRLVKIAIDVSRRDGKNALHPIQYGAAVLFGDGKIASTYQKKALEYGCSLDAVGQLAFAIDEKHHSSKGTRTSEDESKPILLVQADQYGVVHAPFAPGRAFLNENKICEGCHVIVQMEVAKSLKRKKSAEILLVKASDLAPSAPDIWSLS